MGTRNRLDHRQAQAGPGGFRGEKRLTQTRQHGVVDTAAAIADTQAQGVFAGVQMNLQTDMTAAGLNGVFDEIENGPDQGVATAQQLADMAVTLPADRQVLHMGQCGRLQRLHQLPGGYTIGQGQLAAGKHQHIAHLVLQLMQALLESPGETLLGFDRQRLLGQMACIQQRGRQWRTNLMSQRRDHSPQGRQAFVAGQLILQMTGFSQVVEQHQLTGFCIQRARGNRQTPTVLEGHFMAVVFTGRKATGNDMPPQLTLKRQPKQFASRRIGLAHDAQGINDDDAAG